MARTIRFEEMDETTPKNQAPGHFWEQWFRAQPPTRPPRRKDEHSIWEQAIHLGILAAEKAKY